ncbi:MAG: alpha/beta hydrolase [Mariniblastus sp.]
MKAQIIFSIFGMLAWASFGFPTIGQAQEKQEIKIWPNGLPEGSVQLDAKKIEQLKAKEAVHDRGHKLYVDSPTLTIYPAPAKNANGCAVVVCPGGGYNVLAWKHEGLELAEWFNSIGVTAFVLKYRVPRRIPNNIHWEPMQDVQRAIRLVRHDAKKYKIDPSRIGVLGFSAGGHLTVMSGVQYETKCYEPTDEADLKSARPDFICPIYAAYLADGYKDNKAELGPLVTVNENTPPTFMAVTWDDTMRGAQAALLFSRLKENNVVAELHAYSVGGHGYGIRESDKPVSGWHHHLEAWMKVSGFLDADSKPKEPKITK